MSTVFIIVSVVGLILLLFVLIKLKADKYFILDAFNKNNVIVYGKKGCGKDLVFNYVINKRKRKCKSNIQFNEKYCTVASIKSLELDGIDYMRLIDDNVIPVKKTLVEREDYFLSDGGIYLPSQYTSYLDKQYKSLPITYALSRHLAEMNVHINTQALCRPWNKLREQADTYIRCVKTFKIFGLLITKMYVYDKYESAQSNLLPFKASGLASKQKKALKEQFKASNGIIRTCYIIQSKRTINYDTRALHKVIYGIPAPKREKRKNLPKLRR